MVNGVVGDLRTQNGRYWVMFIGSHRWSDLGDQLVRFRWLGGQIWVVGLWWLGGQTWVVTWSDFFFFF